MPSDNTQTNLGKPSDVEAKKVVYSIYSFFNTFTGLISIWLKRGFLLSKSNGASAFHPDDSP
jgi:hypothetical protein